MAEYLSEHYEDLRSKPLSFATITIDKRVSKRDKCFFVYGLRNEANRTEPFKTATNQTSGIKG